MDLSTATGQEITATNVAPGVSWRQDVDPSGPISYNILQIDISNSRVKLKSESAQDKLFAGESVLSTARRETVSGNGEVVAAVNGDFWSDTPRPYSPIGLLVADGMIYNMPARNRSAFVLTKSKQPFIGVVTLDVSLKSEAGNIKIDRINSGTGNSENIVLFTPPYGSEIEPAAGKRYILKMVPDAEFLPNQPIEVQVQAIAPDTTTSLAKSTLLLHVPASKTGRIPALENGTRMTLEAVVPQVKGVVASVCGGGPALIRNGVLQSGPEGLSKNFAVQQSPRTALGFTRDNKTAYLVTVDGRRPRHSVGTSLGELAEYLQKLGCYNAINLDGGGSTTMVVKDKIVNKPSNLFGAEVVASSLLVVVN